MQSGKSQFAKRLPFFKRGFSKEREALSPLKGGRETERKKRHRTPENEFFQFFFFFFFFLHKRRSPAVAQSKDEITSRRCFDVDTAGLRLAPGRNKGANNSSRVARRGGSRERTTVNYTVLIDGRRSWNAVVQGVLRSSVDHARQTGRPTRFGRDREYRQLD